MKKNAITYMSTVKFSLNHALAYIVTLDYISIMEILHLLLVKIALKWHLVHNIIMFMKLDIETDTLCLFNQYITKKMSIVH